nr:MAG TPA: hypothetical protein [Caudoviricetes sp.]
MLIKYCWPLPAPHVVVFMTLLVPDCHSGLR